ncbi:UDP-N-acetylmuramoylalanine--D-glutamate ligase [Mesonia hippocampi]|uniref:UDP-N-acetylmuramoylalanine--D-glutamate ligase n=1 Tax=Mesonia hippocampi TaxID=1628250 RepID=A0A840ET96_9FLAO|nr:UDP-N-acetylmuramoyl-L-alanine--D-glutamate ligase [Mesonia hippocampi]MBB4118646.1 UDP-N-acetylmuramoylalanine--D-glutamate ligase [Mesonia hippocampi]
MKNIVVLGGGESGVGAAILAKQKGYQVFLSDIGKIANEHKKVLLHHAINWEENQHTKASILAANVVVKSPGIPDTIKLIKEIKEKGIPVISEIEFAAQHTQIPIIAITGSNGKTTTTQWIFDVLKRGGLTVEAVGNIGESFAKAVAEKTPDYFVVEVSSFQLDGIKTFRPHIAVLTNITPDHLDRYEGSFEKYTASKFRLIENQTAEDYFIYDSDNEVIKNYVINNNIQGIQIPLSLKPIKGSGTYIEAEDIIIETEKTTIHMPNTKIALQGEHNAKNAMAAATVAKLLKIRKQTIRESLENFQGVEHRLEKVLKINNVQYINDSKATNINATYYALDSMSENTIWIVGGVDKGNNYQELIGLVNEKVKAIICLGVDNEKIKSSFSNCVDTILETSSMQEAVNAAYSIAEKGNTVLLSPACASFDLFENYEDRGRQFKEAIRNL